MRPCFCADMWHAHLRGEETSLNPLGMVEALIGAMQHAESLQVRRCCCSGT